MKKICLICLPPSHSGDISGLISKHRIPALHLSLLCTSQPLHGSYITWKLAMELPFLPHPRLQPRRSSVASEAQGSDFMPPAPPMHHFRRLQATSLSTCNLPMETLFCSTCSISPLTGTRREDPPQPQRCLETSTYPKLVPQHVGPLAGKSLVDQWAQVSPQCGARAL